MTPEAPDRRAETLAAPAPPTVAADVRASVRRDIAAPLAVLRASMEAMAGQLTAQDPRGTVLGGALQQLVLLGQNVQALCDYAMPPELFPQACSLEELVRTTHAQLEPNAAARVALACEAGDSRAVVDGVVLARRIAHLVVTHMDELDEALIHASCSGGAPCLHVYVRKQNGRRDRDGGERGLARLLVERDAARMGVRLEEHPRGNAGFAFAFHLPTAAEARA
ncbi:MAG: HAMP domain-containing histidine kinase [Planctomycetes bacterium]|nr:HAMP domain-containing histidine kinase [Planctomycetota bacterium]